MRKSENPEELIFKLVLILFFSGVGLIANGRKRWKNRRKIEDTPSSTIKSAPQGLAHIHGHAIPYRKSFKTLNGRAAAYLHFQIQALESNDGSSSWVTKYEENKEKNFLVSDGTGIVKVDSTHAELILQERTWKWSTLPVNVKNEFMKEYSKYVEDLKPAKTFFARLTRNKIRIIENVIYVGAPVYIRGNFNSPSNPLIHAISPHTYRFLGEVKKFRDNPQKLKKFLDLNKNGRIEEEELALGTSHMYEYAKRKILPEDEIERVQLQGQFKYDFDHDLIIGDTQRQHLASRLDWGILLMISGSLLITAAIWIIYSYSTSR